jgi:hypothetical protein
LGGSLSDYQSQKIISKKFSENFFNTFLNYDKEPHRHSPLLIIILAIFEKFNINDIIIRLINLHFLLLIIFFFKKCLEIKFNYINKKVINIISLLIFISPTFRSLSIWPDSRLYGILFFTVSIFGGLSIGIPIAIPGTISCIGIVNAGIMVNTPLVECLISDAIFMTDNVNTSLHNCHFHIGFKGPTGPPIPGMI